MTDMPQCEELTDIVEMREEEWTGYWDILCNKRQSPSLLMVFSQFIFYLYENLDSEGSSFSILSMLTRERAWQRLRALQIPHLYLHNPWIFFINLHMERLWMLTTWTCWIISICQRKHHRLSPLLTMLKLPSFPRLIFLYIENQKGIFVFTHDMVTYYEAVKKGFTLSYNVNVPPCFITQSFYTIWT